MFHDELSLNKEINHLYDRLQQAHEERDKYKKALEEIMDDFNNDIYSHEIVADVVREALK